MYRLVGILLCIALGHQVGWAENGPSLPLMVSPAPEILIAQIDDSDMRDEETLNQLMQIEYDRDKMSAGKAIALSFVPGGGLGLIYADKSIQSIVPYSLFGAGLVMSILHFIPDGPFHSKEQTYCRHLPTASRVGTDECLRGDRARVQPKDPNIVDNQDVDPRAIPSGQAYFETKSDYEQRTVGENYDPTNRGLLVLAASYAVTTALGAVWSAMAVNSFNEQLRKDIESTAKNRSYLNVEPLVAYTGDGGLFGVTVDF